VMTENVGVGEVVSISATALGRSGESDGNVSQADRHRPYT
jgi:hypothetical protein